VKLRSARRIGTVRYEVEWQIVFEAVIIIIIIIIMIMIIINSMELSTTREALSDYHLLALTN
jgi:uncharacterized integral membrane protein